VTRVGPSPPQPLLPRDPLADLKDLLGAVEDAYRQGAIDLLGGTGISEAKGSQRSGEHLVDLAERLRRWWP
jgi:hypothetical protein